MPKNDMRELEMKYLLHQRDVLKINGLLNDTQEFPSRLLL